MREHENDNKKMRIIRKPSKHEGVRIKKCRQWRKKRRWGIFMQIVIHASPHKDEKENRAQSHVTHQYGTSALTDALKNLGALGMREKGLTRGGATTEDTTEPPEALLSFLEGRVGVGVGVGMGVLMLVGEEDDAALLLSKKSDFLNRLLGCAFSINRKTRDMRPLMTSRFQKNRKKR
jgi:hypothetical protein